MEYIAIAFVIAVTGFVGFAAGQSRMRKKGKLKVLKMLIEARNLNGFKGRQKRSMDNWLTDKINPLMAQEMKGEL